jgi:hypothetical protein
MKGARCRWHSTSGMYGLACSPEATTRCLHTTTLCFLPATDDGGSSVSSLPRLSYVTSHSRA